MPIQIKLRRGTAAHWTERNPVLADGEQGLETDTRQVKMGNGVDPWNSLPYPASSGPNVTGSGVISVTTDEVTGSVVVDLTEDAAHRFATDEEKADWNAKQAALGFTPEQTGVAADLLNDHITAADPHPTYTTAAELVSGLAGKADTATTLAGYGITDAAPKAHSDSTANPHSTTAAQVGADATGTAEGLVAAHTGEADPHPGYALESSIGQPDGIAPLDSTGKVAAVYLPSFVDDVLEVASYAALPVTGEAGKIYTTLDDNKIYRWGGSAYVSIAASPGSTDDVAEGATNKYFTAARALGAVLAGFSSATGTVVDATHSVLQALGFLQKQTSDNATAITGKAASGPITTSGLTQATAKLLGRGTAGTGAVEEITLGTGLALSGTTLNAANTPLTTAMNYAPTVTIASAATTNIAGAASNAIIVTGSTTITALGTVTAGAERVVTFAGALTLTHNATSLILPGAASITAAAGDAAYFVSLGSGNWRCTGYQRASGTSLVGLANFTESVSTAAPNATVPVVRLLAANAAVSADFALSPKVNGALTAQVADNTATGGNKRGINAVDWQMSRTAAANVASGSCAVISGGHGNTAAGGYSFVGGGFGNTASGGQSTVPAGLGNVADALRSMASGSYSTTRLIDCSMVWGNGAGLGSHQVSKHLLRKDTANATATVLTSDAGAAASTNTVCLPNNASYYLRMRVIARNTTTGVSKAWKSEVLITRGANAASTAIVGTPTITSDFGDASLSAADVALTANTTIGGLEITVTGIAATNLRWLAHVEALETTN